MDDREFLTAALTRVTASLARAGFDFALAGGLAYSALVEPRATVDMDLLILAGKGDLPDLQAALETSFDSVVPHKEVMAFEKARIWRALGITGNREFLVDFLLADTAFHKAALTRKQTVEFQGTSLPIVTIEDLLLLKTLASRPQDAVDITNIQAAYPGELDMDYVREWAERLGIPGL